MNRAHTFSDSLALAVCNLVLLLDLSCAPSAYAQNQPSIQALFSFACDPNTKVCPDGKSPNSLIQSADGNFYGTTTTSGTGNLAAGTVFKITPSGQLHVIYTFVADQNGKYPNGEFPNSLVEGNDGFLYGTAYGGAYGNGVVFKLSRTGTIQVLHSFCSPTNCVDGATPAHLMLAADGNFYGDDESGVLFRIRPTGAFTVLYTLSISRSEGPSSLGMTQASDGNLYGTTLGGGTLFTTLFRLTPAGQFTVLHTFRYPSFPGGAPLQGSDGKLYGTWGGGTFQSGLDGAGFTEYQLPRRFQVVSQASDGNLWSPIFNDTDLPNGAVLTISTKGTLLQTTPFDGTNGAEPWPYTPLVQASDGKLLGVTYAGGSVSQGEVANGVIFTLDAGLAAPKAAIVSFNPSHGKVGTHVVIHGNHFVGATAVTFNGVSAAFHVLNTGNIRATVPPGATTGPIAVTNPGGTTVSSNQFTVR
jgi:uncharacterized repeat protein (TIGR03803 family)